MKAGGAHWPTLAYTGLGGDVAPEHFCFRVADVLVETESTGVVAARVSPGSGVEHFTFESCRGAYDLALMHFIDAEPFVESCPC